MNALVHELPKAQTEVTEIAPESRIGRLLWKFVDGNHEDIQQLRAQLVSIAPEAEAASDLRVLLMHLQLKGRENHEWAEALRDFSSRLAGWFQPDVDDNLWGLSLPADDETLRHALRRFVTERALAAAGHKHLRLWYVYLVPDSGQEAAAAGATSGAWLPELPAMPTSSTARVTSSAAPPPLVEQDAVRQLLAESDEPELAASVLQEVLDETWRNMTPVERFVATDADLQEAENKDPKLRELVAAVVQAARAKKETHDDSDLPPEVRKNNERVWHDEIEPVLGLAALVAEIVPDLPPEEWETPFGGLIDERRHVLDATGKADKTMRDELWAFTSAHRPAFVRRRLEDAEYKELDEWTRKVYDKFFATLPVREWTAKEIYQRKVRPILEAEARKSDVEAKRPWSPRRELKESEVPRTFASTRDAKEWVLRHNEAALPTVLHEIEALLTPASPKPRALVPPPSSLERKFAKRAPAVPAPHKETVLEQLDAWFGTGKYEPAGSLRRVGEGVVRAVESPLTSAAAAASRWGAMDAAGLDLHAASSTRWTATTPTAPRMTSGTHALAERLLKEKLRDDMTLDQKIATLVRLQPSEARARAIVYVVAEHMSRAWSTLAPHLQRANVVLTADGSGGYRVSNVTFRRAPFSKESSVSLERERKRAKALHDALQTLRARVRLELDQDRLRVE